MNVIFDTNVLVAALMSSKGASFRLLSIADDARLKWHLSTPLVVEYEAVLKREIRDPAPEDIEAILDYLCLISEKHEIFYLWRPVLRDPKDDHILELAVKTGAMIVTWNLKDFKAAVKFGIEAITPAELLKRMESKP